MEAMTKFIPYSSPESAIMDSNLWVRYTSVVTRFRKWFVFAITVAL